MFMHKKKQYLEMLSKIVVPESYGNIQKNVQAVYQNSIKRVVLQLFFTESSTNPYNSFVILTVATFQKLRISKARKINQVSVKERLCRIMNC